GRRSQQTSPTSPLPSPTPAGPNWKHFLHDQAVGQQRSLARVTAAPCVTCDALVENTLRLRWRMGVIRSFWYPRGYQKLHVGRILHVKSRRQDASPVDDGHARTRCEL